MAIDKHSVKMNLGGNAGAAMGSAAAGKKPGYVNRAPEYRGDDFSDGLEVTEIHDVKGFDPSDSSDYTIMLAGARLPKIPFSWGGTQRITKEYYPGNPEPSMQILGSQEANVTLEGRWTDRRSERGTAYRHHEYFDALRRRGNLIYMRLGTWQRYGYIEEVEFRMKNLGDIEWKLTFSVIGENKPFHNFFAGNRQEIPLDLSVQLAVATAQIIHTPPEMPRRIQGEVSTSQMNLFSAISAATKFIDNIISQGEMRMSQVKRAILLVKNIRAEISRFKRRLGMLFLDVNDIPSVLSKKERQAWIDSVKHSILDIQHSLSRPTGASDAGSAAAEGAAGYKAKTKADAAATAALAAQMLMSEASREIAKNIRTTPSIESLIARLDKQLTAIGRTIPLGRHRVKVGDTLAKIALKFYKNADEWKKIYDHNKLTDTKLVPGVILEVPRL